MPSETTETTSLTPEQNQREEVLAVDETEPLPKPTRPVKLSQADIRKTQKHQSDILTAEKIKNWLDGW